MFKFSKSHRFGIEIEFISPLNRSSLKKAFNNAGIKCIEEDDDYALSSWELKYDNSIKIPKKDFENGIRFKHEIASPILSGQKAFDVIKKVVEILNNSGCKVNKSCGFHVHHELKTKNEKKVIFNLLKMYQQYEEVFDTIVPESRKKNKNKYCQSLKKMNLEAMLQKFQRLGENYHYIQDSRYYKINTLSLNDYGTVEFRHLHSTLNYEIIKNWIILTDLLMKTSSKEIPNYNHKEFIDWLKNQGIDFYANSINYFFKENNNVLQS